MRTFLLTSVAALGVCSAAHADLLANWTFEVSVPLVNDSMNSGSYAAEGGLFGPASFATGHHASGNTDYSNPVGNGSNESFSSNTWATGDYYQFSTSTLLYENISFGWSQTRSSTGPTTFDVEWSTDGVNFNTLVNDYTVASVTWSSGATDPGTIFSPVTGPANLDNQALVYFRLTSQMTPGNAAGTSRVDDIIINGDLVPAPGGLALLGAAGVVAARRRR